MTLHIIVFFLLPVKRERLKAPVLSLDRSDMELYASLQDHQLKTPLLTLLGPFMTNGDPCERLFGDIIRDFKNGKKQQKMIESFFVKRPDAPPAVSRWREMS